MANVRFRPLQPGDVAYLATNLREADKHELVASRGVGVDFGEALARAVMLSSHLWTAADPTDLPIAIFGVAPVSLLAGVGSPWLLGTERVFDHPRTLVIEGRRYLSRMRETYPDLFNYVDARNEQSIRWLKRVGFTVHPAAPYGAEGLPFHKFEITRAE